MPFGAPVYYGLLWILNGGPELEAQLSQADTEGMIVRHVRLDGVATSRMLSYAEVEALRHDLEDR